MANSIGEPSRRDMMSTTAIESLLQLNQTELYLSIFASIATIIGIFIAIVTLLLTRKQYKTYVEEYKANREEYALSNKRLAAEKAIEIAKLFQQEIIPCITFLQKIYKYIGYYEYMQQRQGIIEQAGAKTSYDFDAKELKSLYGVEDGIGNLFLTKVTHECVYSSIHLLPAGNYDIGSSGEQAIALVKMIRNRTLNTLEWACMLMTSKVAEKKQIYQSLHQAFLKYISLEYPNIAERNTNSFDKYYTNIIEIYNEWITKARSDEKCELEAERAAELTKRSLMPQTTPVSYAALNE